MTVRQDRESDIMEALSEVMAHKLSSPAISIL
jgi:hypothetical protein